MLSRSVTLSPCRPGVLSAVTPQSTSRLYTVTTMRTRSRQGAGEGKPAEEEAQAAPTPRSTPRSTKKRRAPETSTAAAPAAETKKSKGAASTAAAAAAVATPPPKVAKSKGASLKEAKRSTPSKPSKGAGSRGKAVEDQSLAKDADHNASTAVAAGLGVAPKGRCVSGRDWKARNQSQRCGCAPCRGAVKRCAFFPGWGHLFLLQQ